MFAEKIQTYIPLPDVYNVKNSVQLIEGLSDIPFDPNLKLASFDIVNMYTNIPNNELIRIIGSICDIYKADNTSKQDILKMSNLLNAQNCLRFRDKTYLQNNGLATGAPPLRCSPKCS